MNVLDLFFPKKCVLCGRFGVYICRNCFSKIEFIEAPICPVCMRQAIGGKTHPGCRRPFGLDGLVVAAKYHGAVRLAIQKIKYRLAWDVSEVLISLFDKVFWRYSLPGDLILVPIPLSRQRQKWRGFNQAQVIARLFAKEYKTGVWADLLLRKKETKTQVGLKKMERVRNIRGAFEFSGKIDLTGKNLMLVDDVYTTGSTMKEAAKVLKRAGAKSVWGMAIALD